MRILYDTTTTVTILLDTPREVADFGYRKNSVWVEIISFTYKPQDDSPKPSSIHLSGYRHKKDGTKYADSTSAHYWARCDKNPEWVMKMVSMAIDEAPEVR